MGSFFGIICFLKSSQNDSWDEKSHTSDAPGVKSARGLDSVHKVALLKVLCTHAKLLLRRMCSKKGNMGLQ